MSTSFHTSPDWEKISSTLLTGQSWRLGLQLFAQARGFKSCASHQPMHQTWMILNLDQNWEVFFHMFEKLWNLNVDPYKIMTSNVSSPSKFWYFRQLTVTELFETFHHWSLAQKNTSLVVFFDWWQHLLFETTLEGSDTWENDVPLRCHAKSSQIQKNDTPPPSSRKLWHQRGMWFCKGCYVRSVLSLFWGGGSRFGLLPPMLYCNLSI